MKLEWRDVEIGGVTINTSLTSAETAELQRLADGKDVLEVGSAYGYSTIAMALVANKVTAVDPHRDLNSLHALVANLAAAGVTDKVWWIAGTSRDVLPTLGPAFDLIFIDGDHTFAEVAHDVAASLPLLRPGGILACHDLDEDTCPGVRQAIDAWRQPDYVIDTLAVYVNLNPVRADDSVMAGSA